MQVRRTLVRRGRADAGIGLVEYALAMALVVVGLIGVVERLQSSEAERLADSGDRIGLPDLHETYGVPTGPVVPTDPSTPPVIGPVTPVDLVSIASAAHESGNNWSATVTLETFNALVPLAEVTITGTWSPSANQQETSCTTDAAGVCRVTRWNLKVNQIDERQVIFTITGVSGAGIDGAALVGRTIPVDAPAP